MFLLTLASFGFDANKQTQTQMAITGILVAIFAIPAILVGVSAIILLFFYPLDGPEWRKQKKYIMELHEQKEKVQKLVEGGKIKT